MGTVEHRLRALVKICGTCPMLMPCAVQLRLTTSIACHAVNDRPSTRPVRTSRSTWGRPRIVPDTVATQPITSTTDTDDLHDANPSHPTLRTRWRGWQPASCSQRELRTSGRRGGLLPPQ